MLNRFWNFILKSAEMSARSKAARTLVQLGYYDEASKILLNEK